MKMFRLGMSILMLGSLVVAAGYVLADWGYEREHEEHDYEHEGRGFYNRWFGEPRPVIDPVGSKLYAEECGSCHYAYQPGLLPKQSWEIIMSNLSDHFGENAELSDETAQQIKDYLLRYSAGIYPGGLPNRISASTQGYAVPIRITETRFFQREHGEIPRRFVEENDQIRSFSNCDACHTRAKVGSFREHEIRIPGIGRWDD